MKARFFILALVVLVLIFTACSEDDPAPGDNSDNINWVDYGLSNLIINHLKIDGNTIYATTSNGFYKRSLDGSADWQLLGLEGKKTLGMIIYSANDIIVTIDDPQNTVTNPFYHYDGQNFSEIQNNYGNGENEPVYALERDPSDPQTLYATGLMVVARSVDRGATWSPVYGAWGSIATGLDVMRINPNDHDELWTGGQNAIETGIIAWSEDQGQTWDQKTALVESPSVLKEMAFHPENEDIIYAGWEGGITKTTDGGQTWNVIRSSEESKFYFGLELLPSNPEVVYAGGWLKRFDEPQPLILYRSEDGGQTWESFEYPAKDFGGIHDLVIRSDESATEIYLGLYKGGVMKVVVP